MAEYNGSGIGPNDTYTNLHGEQVTSDRSGGTYTSHQNILGDTVTHDDRGGTYYTTEGFHGEKHTIGPHNEEIITTTNLFGDTVSYVARPGIDYNSSAGTARPAAAIVSTSPYNSGARDAERLSWYRSGRIADIKKKIPDSSANFEDLQWIAYILLGVLRIFLIYRDPSAEAFYRMAICPKWFCVPTSLVPVIGELLLLLVSGVNLYTGEWSTFPPYAVILLIRAAVFILIRILGKNAKKIQEKRTEKAIAEVDREVEEKEKKADERIARLENKLRGTYAYKYGDRWSEFKLILNEAGKGKIYFPDDPYHYYSRRGYEEYETVGWRLHREFRGSDYIVYLRVNFYTGSRSDDFTVSEKDGQISISWEKERDGMENGFWSDEACLFRIE